MAAKETVSLTASDKACNSFLQTKHKDTGPAV